MRRPRAIWRPKRPSATPETSFLLSLASVVFAAVVVFVDVDVERTEFFEPTERRRRSGQILKSSNQSFAAREQATCAPGLRRAAKEKKEAGNNEAQLSDNCQCASAKYDLLFD